MACLHVILFITVLVDAVSSAVYCSFKKYSTNFNYYYSNYKQSTTYYIQVCGDYCSYNSCGDSYSQVSTSYAYTASLVGVIIGSVLGIIVLGVSVGVACYCGRVKRGSPGQILNPVVTSTIPYTPTPDMGHPSGSPGVGVISTPPYPVTSDNTTVASKNDDIPTSTI
ncbi:uncharacterized protein LOC125656096 [Ostrea edulis]|uniref:uncharacterized protein LOC125656096 n=1 Tax=Ostrea edulis TaxID=37623 RepID=UPI0024AE8F16|nr:uncharacterized protein LOC125656096 [Ostrea edulis]